MQRSITYWKVGGPAFPGLPTVQCLITYWTVGGPAFPGLPTVQRSITYCTVGGPDNKVKIVSLLQAPLAKQMCLE